MTDIAKLRELLAKATPGPWGFDSYNVFREWPDDDYERIFTSDGGYRSSNGRNQENDAAFVAELRNNAEAILDELEALRRVANAVQTAFDTARKQGVDYPPPAGFTSLATLVLEPLAIAVAQELTKK